MQRTEFRDIPADSYPFTIQFFKTTDRQGNNPVHTLEVTGPGVMYVPPIAQQVGCPVWVRARWGDGTVTEDWPP